MSNVDSPSIDSRSIESNSTEETLINSPSSTTTKSSPNLSLSPSSSSYSPLFPLPTELYLASLKYLNYFDLINLLTISKNWNSFLISEPSLWTKLDWIVLNQEQRQSIGKFCSRNDVNNSQKRGNGIESLSVELRNWRSFGFMTRTSTINERLGFLFDKLNQTSVDVHENSSLRKLNLMILQDSNEGFQLLKTFALHGRISTFFTLNSIKIITYLTNFTTGSDFFNIWPGISKLKIISFQGREIPIKHDWNSLVPHRINDYPSIEMGCNLKEIELTGLTIQFHLEFPKFPQLTKLVLNRVNWEGKGLFYLLRLSRKTLIYLELNDFIMSERIGYEEEDWNEFVSIRDSELNDDFIFQDSDELLEDPQPPIIFTALKTLILTGEDTPPIFNSLEMIENSHIVLPFPTPIFVMPLLESLYLRGLSCDLETVEDDFLGGLITLGRNCPSLKYLVLYDLLICDETLFEFLAAMNGKLLQLSLINTAISDQLINKLHNLIPNLTKLNVIGSTDISIQGIARLVEIYHQYNNKLNWIETTIPFHNNTYELKAYQWLDYIAVLHKQDWDFTGLGPNIKLNSGKDYKIWKRYGKLNQDKENQRLRQEADLLKQEKEFQHSQELIKIYGFQQGSSSSSSNQQQASSSSSSPEIGPSSSLLLSNRSTSSNASSIQSIVNTSDSIIPIFTPNVSNNPTFNNITPVVEEEDIIQIDSIEVNQIEGNHDQMEGEEEMQVVDLSVDYQLQEEEEIQQLSLFRRKSI